MASRPQFLPVQTGDCKEEENKLKTLSIGRTNGEHLRLQNPHEIREYYKIKN